MQFRNISDDRIKKGLIGEKREIFWNHSTSRHFPYHFHVMLPVCACWRLYSQRCRGKVEPFKNYKCPHTCACTRWKEVDREKKVNFVRQTVWLNFEQLACDFSLGTGNYASDRSLKKVGWKRVCTYKEKFRSIR